MKNKSKSNKLLRSIKQGQRQLLSRARSKGSGSRTKAIRARFEASSARIIVSSWTLTCHWVHAPVPLLLVVISFISFDFILLLTC